MNKIDLYNGDCLDVMDNLIKDNIQIDAIITDPPYGITVCKWDKVVPFDAMWERFNKLIKPNGAIVLFGCQPFTSALVMSNLSMFKYELIWVKNKIQHFAQAPYRFMTKTENILIFSKGGCSKNANIRMVFNPQGLIYNPRIRKGKKGDSHHRVAKIDQKDYLSEYTNYPNNLLEFNSEINNVHPTQKPVALMEYLIKTYTNENETVLDCFVGSGTTGVACKNISRNFIGIEKDENYFEIAKNRIEDKYNKVL